jgi:peroxiredoxin
MELKLGTLAPDFRLPEPNGRIVSLADFHGAAAYVIMFICNHCPYVKHIRAELAKIGREYQTRQVAVIAINSNDAKKYPDDSPEKMKEEIKAAGYSFPYLFDETQEIAREYRAACTPDFFLFDRHMKLIYRGQLDDSRPGNNIPVTGKDLRGALETLLASKPVSEKQTPSMGCNIKWKPGNEPDYFG